MTTNFSELDDLAIAEHFLSVFEVIPGNCALIKVSPSLLLYGVSTGFAQLHNQVAENLVGKHFLDLTTAYSNSPRFKTEITKSINNVITHKCEHQFDLNLNEIKSGNGHSQVNHYSIINKPVVNKQGNVVYIMHTVSSSTMSGIAQHVNSKNDSEKQAYNLFMQAPTAICIIRGEQLVIELANQKILDIWRKPPEIVGLPLIEAIPEIKGTHFPQLLADVRLTGKPYYANESHAYFMRNGKEELVYFNFVYQPYYDESSSEAIGVLVIANEVTEQVLARKKIEENELRYSNLIAEAVVATAVYEGHEMKISYANEAMLKLWGKNKSVIGKTIRQALPELDGQPFHDLLDNVYTSGETYWGKEDKGEIVVDGVLQSFYFNFTYKALRNSYGAVYGILNMAIDVTDQVLAKLAVRENEVNLQHKVEERTKELELKNSKLERSNAELDQFAYVASHDLQEPLRKIRIFGDKLSKLIEEKSDASIYVEKIQAASLRMAGLINSLLDYSRLSDNYYGFEQVNLNTVIQNVITDFELLIAQKKAVVTFKELPVIEAISLQMNQLFYNLIGNALKFARKDVKPEITISASALLPAEKEKYPQLNQQMEYWVFMVKDNGIGFNQEYANKIFTIFQRLNDRSLFGGYGIGLALCKKVADTHNGIVYAEGRPKEGATFTIILPAKH